MQTTGTLQPLRAGLPENSCRMGDEMAPQERVGPLPWILLVEDDLQLAETISWVLEDAGYRVDIAVDGQTGWEKIQVEQPALVLLDWRLPRLTGSQFAGLLHQRFGETIPIVLMTAGGGAPEKA